jgi:hypothetical protein
MVTVPLTPASSVDFPFEEARTKGVGWESLEITIWRNEAESGPSLSVTATRSHERGEQWRISE